MNQAERNYMADHIYGQVKQELIRAEQIHGSFHSLHEGIAVLREEYRELEDAVFWGIQRTGRVDGIQKEAVQVAAMAIRLAMMVTATTRKMVEEIDALEQAEKEVD